MRQFIVATFALVFLFVSAVALAADTKKTTLGVKGMSCHGCALAIESKVNKIEGISEIEVDLKAGKATIEYDPEEVSPEDLADVINEMGFKASVPEEEDAKSAEQLESVD